jgi:hypothetical protein
MDQEILVRGLNEEVEIRKQLAARGVAMDATALAAYAARLHEETIALRQAVAAAQAVVASLGEDEGVLGQAMVALLQQKFFTILVSHEPEILDPATLARLLRSITDLVRTDATGRRCALDLQKRRDAARKEEAEKEAKTLRQADDHRGSLDAETLDYIGKQIYGSPLRTENPAIPGLEEGHGD